jgi:hypothetical protein
MVYTTSIHGTLPAMGTEKRKTNTATNNSTRKQPAKKLAKQGSFNDDSSTESEISVSDTIKLSDFEENDINPDLLLGPIASPECGTQELSGGEDLSLGGDLETKPKAKSKVLIPQCHSFNGIKARQPLTRHYLTEDLTVQDSTRPMKGWKLISFSEFNNLKLVGKVKATKEMISRLGPKATPEILEKEVLRMRDLRDAVKEEAENQLKAMMLEEGRHAFQQKGMEEPNSWDDIRKTWHRYSDVETAEAIWHVMYGMFDQIDLLSGRKGMRWERRLEKMLMQKMNIAYLADTIPAGTYFLEWC